MKPLFWDLLIGAGAVSAADLKRCLELAFDKGLSLTDLLTTDGICTHKVVWQTIRLQRLIRHADLPMDMAIKVLTESIKTSQDVVTVLAELFQWQSNKIGYVSEVGRMLLEAEVVPPEVINKVLLEQVSQHLPLGTFLAEKGFITQNTLWSALKAASIADVGRLSRGEVIEYLKTAVKRGFLLELVLPEASDSKRPGEWVRLGELLATSGVVDEANILVALEGSMELGIPLGKYITSKSILTQEQVHKALEIQTLVSTGTITPLQATGVAKQVVGNGVPISEAIKKVRDTAEYVKRITESNKVIALDES
ncbi:MAG: hypothetical protein K2W95_19490 [Candidatus Obscuribacterales bacterium]|nr:hypothetical protein [Candidatus Obscuribacterales bacterium]